MRTLKSGIFALTALAFVVVSVGIAGTPTAFAQADKKTIIMFEWPTGYGPPEQSVALARMVSENSPDIYLVAQETPGFVYNIKVMVRESKRWENTVFATSSGAEWLSKKGIKPFFDEPVTQEWKFLWGECIWTGGNMVALDPKIKTPADLKGKRLGLGLRTQTHHGGFATVILKEGYGVTDENSTLEYLGPKAAVDALLDGRVDAAAIHVFTTIGLDPIIPSGQLLQLGSSGRKFHYLDLTPEVLAKVNKKTGSPFLSLHIPAGKMPGQTEPVYFFGDVGWKTVHPSFSEDLAYKLVKAVIANAPEVGKYFAFGKLWAQPDLFVLGLNEQNTHPGAIKAFKEAGIWEKRRSTLQ